MKLPIMFISRKRLENLESQIVALKKEQGEINEAIAVLHKRQEEVNSLRIAGDRTLFERNLALHFSIDDQRKRLERAINHRLNKNK